MPQDNWKREHFIAYINNSGESLGEYHIFRIVLVDNLPQSQASYFYKLVGENTTWEYLQGLLVAL